MQLNMEWKYKKMLLLIGHFMANNKEKHFEHEILCVHKLIHQFLL